MRWTSLGGLLAVVLSASCVVQVGSDSGGGSTPAKRPQARKSSPTPAPGPAPTLFQNLKPAAAPERAPTPAPTPAPAPTPTQASAVAPVKLVPGVNLVKLKQIASRNPKGCGFVEVADNNWVHVDCGRYPASTKALAHLSARKLKLLKAKKTTFKPLRNVNPAMLKAMGALTHKDKEPKTIGAGPGKGGPEQIGESFPDTVDHRELNLEGPIKNQGAVGSCTAHSLSAALDNAAIRAGNLKPGDKLAMTSPMHVWSRYGLPNMGAAADGNIAQPVAVFSDWQQNDAEACMMFQSNNAASADCAEIYGVKPNSWRDDKGLMAKYDKSQAQGIYKISSIEKLEKPVNIDEVLSVLASGSDIWAAFDIDGASWSNRKMKNAVMPDWDSAGSGHAVVVAGYRQTPSGRQFLIHNSWGDSWGDHGYAWLSEKMLLDNMYHAYRVKITNGVKKEDLTDDDCAPDELVDLTTGLCAVLCKDESRPNNGCKK